MDPHHNPGGAYAIAHERQRQIESKGFDAAHDAGHDPGTLLAAAACYLNVAGTQFDCGVVNYTTPPEHWPWERSSWKPSTFPNVNLIKGGALVAAALDRYWNNAPSFLPKPFYVPTVGEISDWANRNGFDQSPDAAKVAIDDARTMHKLSVDGALQDEIDNFVDSKTPVELATLLQGHGMKFARPVPNLAELQRLQAFIPGSEGSVSHVTYADGTGHVNFELWGRLCATRQDGADTFEIVEYGTAGMSEDDEKVAYAILANLNAPVP